MRTRELKAPSWTLPALAAALILVGVSFLQFAPPFLFGIDSYFHARVPHFILEHGASYEFHWARFTTLAERWSDKEYLFHALMTPLALLGDDILLQARVAAVAFAALLLLAFVVALAREEVLPPLAALATLALPLSITFFVYLNVLRPKTLAVAIVLLLARSLIDARWAYVLGLAAVYPLAHVSFPAALALALAVESARWLHGRRFLARNVIAAAAGTAVGVLAHPNFPANLDSLWLNGVLVPWSTVAGGIRLAYGTEWNPVTTRILLLGSPALFAGLLAAAALVVSGRVRPSFPTVSWFAAALLFGVPAMFSFTYWYYACPATAAFLAHLFSDALRGRPGAVRAAALVAAGAVLAASALFFSRIGVIEGEFTALAQRNLHYQRVARWMRANLPPGEIVFHASWSDSPIFIGLNPDNDYLLVLDPIYMHRLDPALYARWEAVSRGQERDPARLIRGIFGARFGYVGADRGLFRQALERPGEFKVLYREPHGLVFEVAPTGGGAGGDLAGGDESPIMVREKANPVQGGTP